MTKKDPTEYINTDMVSATNERGAEPEPQQHWQIQKEDGRCENCGYPVNTRKIMAWMGQQAGEKMTKEQRSDRARTAAHARWAAERRKNPLSKQYPSE